MWVAGMSKQNFFRLMIPCQGWKRKLSHLLPSNSPKSLSPTLASMQASRVVESLVAWGGMWSGDSKRDRPGWLAYCSQWILWPCLPTLPHLLSDGEGRGSLLCSSGLPPSPPPRGALWAAGLKRLGAGSGGGEGVESNQGVPGSLWHAHLQGI